MTRIAVLCNSRLGIPAIQQLAASRQLVACAIPDRMHEENEELSWVCGQLQVPLRHFSRTEMDTEMHGWLTTANPDVVLVFTFPYIVPGKLLDIPRYGFINFHFGPLPAYRGADAIFWQLKNRESMGCISIHRMTAELDKGPIYAIQQVPIQPGDTYGSHSNALAFAGAGAALNLLTLLHQNTPPVAQNEQEACYYKRPALQDVMIDWTKPAAEIVALVNACNPWNKGALSTIDGYPIKVIAAARVPVNPATNPLSPGVIQQAGADTGIVVSCGQNDLISITMCFFANEFAGPQRLTQLGLRPGLRFDITKK